MASLQELRRLSLAEYGLLAGFFGSEDEEFPMPLMQDWINQEHRDFARETLCYREEQTYTLPIGSGGVSVVNLECNVIKPVTDSKVRAYLNGTWVPLAYVSEDHLESDMGPLDNLSNDGPLYYFLRTGSALDAQRQLVCVPGATAAVTSGLRVPCWIYPAEMTAEADGPAMQPSEQRAIIPRVCARMAGMQLAKGVQSARGALEYFRSESQRLEDEVRRAVEDSRLPGGRTIRDTGDWDRGEGWGW